MDRLSPANIYDRKQNGKLWIMMLAIGMLAGGLNVALFMLKEECIEDEGEMSCEDHTRNLIIGLCVIPLTWLLAASVGYQRVTIGTDDVLRVRWGPLPLLQCFFCGKGTIDLSTVTSVEVKRPTCMYGFGVRITHMGIILRLWGLDCVHLHIDGAYDVLVGSDDADGLRFVIQERLNHLVTKGSRPMGAAQTTAGGLA